MFLRSLSIFSGSKVENIFLLNIKKIQTPEARLQYYVSAFSNENAITQHLNFFKNYKAFFQEGSLHSLATICGFDKAHEKQCREAVNIIEKLEKDIAADTAEWRCEHVYEALQALKKIHSSIPINWRSPTGVAGTLEKIFNTYELPADDADFEKMNDILHPLFNRDRVRLRNAIDTYSMLQKQETKIGWI